MTTTTRAPGVRSLAAALAVAITCTLGLSACCQAPRHYAPPDTSPTSTTPAEPATTCTEPDALLQLVDPDTGEYIIPDWVALVRDGHDRNCKRPAAPAPKP